MVEQMVSDLCFGKKADFLGIRLLIFYRRVAVKTIGGSFFQFPDI